MLKSEIIGGFLIGVLALGLALTVNLISPAGIPLQGQWDPAKGTLMANPGEPSLRAEELNNPLKLMRMIGTGALVLIDARHEKAYSEGHLPGAVSFPLYRFDENADAIKNLMKAGTPVVVYCSGVTCHDSHEFAARLVKMGVENVMVYPGGFDEWKEMEFEVVTGHG